MAKPNPPESASTDPPQPPRVGAAFDTANDGFHAAYDDARAGEVFDGPVFVVIGDDLVVFREDGSERRLPFNPRLFHVVKSVAHVPVAIFVALSRGTPEPGLRALSEHVERCRAAVAAESMDDAARAALDDVLSTSEDFVRRLEAEGSSRASDLASFAAASGKELLRLTELATRVQLAALHAVVENALGELAEDSCRRLEVVVAGAHQARERSVAMQYFQKRFGEAEGAEDRVTYAEGAEDAKAARTLVGTRRLDARIARAFFEDEKRLQRDVLGDAARNLLANMALAKIP